MLYLAPFTSELPGSQSEKDSMVPKSSCYLKGGWLESQGAWPVRSVLGGYGLGPGARKHRSKWTFIQTGQAGQAVQLPCVPGVFISKRPSSFTKTF